MPENIINKVKMTTPDNIIKKDEIDRKSSVRKGKAIPPAPEAAAPAKPDDVQDVVSISLESSEAFKVHKWVEMIKQMPDDRQTRLEEIQRQIESGEYLTEDAIKKTAEEIGRDLGVL